MLLRRTISFIDDNAADDISLTDIARAVYVSPRALQYMFRKHRECTPMEYLRQARLRHVRLRELDEWAAKTVRRLLARHSRGGIEPLRVDLSAVDSVSDAAIEVLVHACERARAFQVHCTLMTVAGSATLPIHR